MRKILLLTLILLVSAAWAVAQQGGNSQAPSASSPSQGAAPQTSSGQASQPSSSENSIEGCLGGSAGNYNVIDKAGTSYKLQLPANADTSALDQHIGQEVRVTGTVANAAGSSSGAASTSASSSSGASSASPGSSSANRASIKVSKLQKVGDTCSTNANPPPK